MQRVYALHPVFCKHLKFLSNGRIRFADSSKEYLSETLEEREAFFERLSLQRKSFLV